LRVDPTLLAGEVIAMRLEYPPPTTATYVMSAMALVGAALGLYLQFTEPYSGPPLRFWGQIVLPLGVCALIVSRIVPRLRVVGALLGIPLVVVGIGLLVARHLP
jgi:hypothetical protein